MPSEERRIYWDSCVILHYIEGTPEWLPTLERLLANSADPDSSVELITSTLAIAEVAYTEAEKQQLNWSAEAAMAIERFWSSRAILLAEPYEAIAVEARRIVRASKIEGWSIQPSDAIHLATAKHLGAVVVHTMDKKMLRADGRMPFPITTPDLLWSTAGSAASVQMPLPSDGTIAAEAEG